MPKEGSRDNHKFTSQIRRAADNRQMNEAFQFTKIIIRKVTTTITTSLAIIIIISYNKNFQADGVDADPLVEKEYCQWGKLNISCSPSHVIIIESAIYGRVRVGKCIRDLNKVHNCSWNVGELTDWLCSGRVGCYFDVAQFSMWGVQPCSQELTSNLYIQYRCVQVEFLPFASVIVNNNNKNINKNSINNINNNINSNNNNMKSINNNCNTMTTIYVQHSQHGFLSPQLSRNQNFKSVNTPITTLPSDPNNNNVNVNINNNNSVNNNCGWSLVTEKDFRILLTIFYFTNPRINVDRSTVNKFDSDYSLFSSNKYTSSNNNNNGEDTSQDVIYKGVNISNNVFPSMPYIQHSNKSPSCLRRNFLLTRDRTSGREECASANMNRRVREIFFSDSNHVDVIINFMLTSSSLGQAFNFLLKYQVTNCPLPTFAGSHVVMTSMTSVEVICNSSSQKSKLDCVEGDWSGVVASCPQLTVVSKKDESASSADMWSTITNEWKSPKGLTLVICLGVLLGIAVGMIMLSFAICLIKQKPRCLAETAQQIGEIELYEESANQIFCPLRFNVPTATSAAMQSHPHQQLDKNNSSNYWALNSDMQLITEQNSYRFNNSTTIYAQPKQDVYDSQQKTYPSLINCQQQQFTEQQHQQQTTFSFQTNSTMSEPVATKPQKMTCYIANKTKACSSIIASKSEICDLHFNKFCPDLVRCRDYQSVSYADRNLASVYDSTTLNSTNNQPTDH